MSDGVELKFCDLCGRSIPEKDLESGVAREVAGKTVGVCCLAQLVEGAPKQQAGGVLRAREAGGAGLLLAVALLIVAVVASAWYLDRRAEWRVPRQTLAQLQHGLTQLRQEVDAQREVLAAERSALPGAIDETLAPRWRTIEEAVTRLQEEMPKPGAADEAMKGRLAALANALQDLAARQGALESTLQKSLDAVRSELDEVGRGLVDLRRRAVAAPEAAPKKPEVASLPEALGRYVDQLESADAGVRWGAVDELVRSGDPRVVPYLLPLLQDPDPFVRRLVAEGLAEIGDERVHGALIDALEDKEAIVREAAYRALVKLTGQRFPFDAEASETKRKAYVEKWREWLTKG